MHYNPLNLKVLMVKWPFALCPLASLVALGDALGLGFATPSLETGLNLHNYDQMYQAWSNHLRNQVPKGMRSIAISHAFVMGGDVGGSERTLSIGGSEQVSPQVLKTFTIQPLAICMGLNGWEQTIFVIADRH